MKHIAVRAEPSGKYLNLRWRDPISGRRVAESLGLAATLGKREVKEAVSRKEIELNNDPALASNGSMRLSAWRKRYLLVKNELLPSSVSDIEGAFDRLEEHFTGDPALDTIDATKAANFRLWLESRLARNGQQVSTATVRKTIRQCKAIFKRAHIERTATGVRENPFAAEKSSITANSKTVLLTDDQVKRILDACPDAGWRCLFAIAFYAGPRQQQIRRLTWADILFDHPPIIVIRPIKDKHGRDREDDTKNQPREIPIVPELMAILLEAFNALGPGSAGPCCTVPMDGRSISNWARRIIEKAGVVYPRPLHNLRANRVSRWKADTRLPEADVDKWLGHSKEVSRGYYHKTGAETLEIVTGKPAENQA